MAQLTKNDIEGLKIGRSINWKFGLVTRDIYRISENLFELTDTSDGWLNATVTKNTLIKVIEGKKDILTLNWG